MALGDHDHERSTNTISDGTKWPWKKYQQERRWCQEITTTKEAPTIVMVLNNHNHERRNNDNNGVRWPQPQMKHQQE